MTRCFSGFRKSSVSARLLQIIDYIKSVRPGIRILWSGYMYPNFEEVLNNNPLGNNHPFYGTWQKMEFPTFLQLNTILNDFSADVEAYAATDPQVDFINATGLMQYTFGQNTALGVTPGGSYAPFSVPLPAGKPDYPSPRNSMRDYLGITKDCFHLSAKGYADMIEYHTQKFYHKLFMDDLYLLTENNAQTGSVSSLGNVADTLVLGESGGESFSTILSFNTTGMADTTLSRASIFLRRKSLSGTNPISNSLEVKVKSGNLGATANVEATDFNAQADGSGTPCLFGSNTGNGHWIRLDLPASILGFINKNNITQFEISAPGFTGGKVVFDNASDAEFAPVLNLVYKENISGVGEFIWSNKLRIYPNPATDVLYIEAENETVESVEVIDLYGRTVLQKNEVATQLDVSGLPAGLYAIQVKVGSGSVTQSFLKQ